MANIYYNLFLRNWVNNVATEEQIAQAVTKGYTTQAEADKILATPKNV